MKKTLQALLALGVVICSGASLATPADSFANKVASQGTAISSPFGAQKTVLVDIVANRTAGTPQADYKVAIRLQHAPGWHTYWRFPGDTGYATTVTWKMPNVHWKISPLGEPLPARDTKGSLTNFIHSGTTLLPFKLEIPWGTPYGTSGTISAHVEYLACKDICVPGEADVRFSVPIRVASTPSEHAAAFQNARLSIPEKIESKYIKAVVEDSRLRIDMEPLAGKIDRTVEFFPLDPGVIDFSAGIHQEVKNGVTSLYLTLPKKFMQTKHATLHGVVVADHGPARSGWAIETQIPITYGTVAGGPATPKNSANRPLLQARVVQAQDTVSLTTLTALGFAILGGLILNLMPCVFPVLSLKILQLVDTQRRRGSLALHGLSFTLGTACSMLFLAGVLIALRQLGISVGWGFQLQSPAVVAVLALLFFAISLNLFGLFEFTAASHLADARAVKSLPTTGPAGSFWTGVLAVVVASPCTAPFMGAALGFAISQPVPQTILIFLGLGLGMALPWLILTLVPVWTRLLPKPGAWMLNFKRIMALPMVAAFCWLFWVLSRQVNVYGLITLIFACACATAFFWSVGREQYGRGKSTVLKLLTGMAALCAISLIAAGSFSRAQTPMLSHNWEVWSENAVNQAITEGHPVMVDFTAAWCVTCQFNKATAIDTAGAHKIMDDLGYRRFVADWTNRDTAISKILNAFGRTGVPLYLLYDAKGSPTILPELLTESSFIEALQKNALSKP